MLFVKSARQAVIRGLGLIALFGMIQAAAVGQTTAGGFHGTVTDSTGAVLPGATVQVKNLATSVVRQATSNSVGFYTITQLPPGHYSITASKSGFTTAQQADVQLQVNEDAEANYTLGVGQVTQRVEVTAAPPALQTSNATIGQVIGARQVVDLPLNGRDRKSVV